MDALMGVTPMETRVAAITVRVVVLVTFAEVAVIREVPCALQVAKPQAEMVPTPGFEEFQVTDLVRSLVLPSV